MRAFNLVNGGLRDAGKLLHVPTQIRATIWRGRRSGGCASIVRTARGCYGINHSFKCTGKRRALELERKSLRPVADGGKGDDRSVRSCVAISGRTCRKVDRFTGKAQRREDRTDSAGRRLG